VFQRTPIWCLPKADAPIPAAARLMLRRVPGMLGLSRLASQTLVELLFPLAAHFPNVLPFIGGFERRALDHMRREIHDPELREKLIPRYALGCKRPAFHNEYLATYNRSNVTLETTPITRIEPRGVVTEDGTVHEIDVLVLATGFKVFEPDNMPPFPVVDRAGTELGKWWAEHRHQAYEGVSVPGFPNYFLMCGPYSYNGSSYFNLVQTQARHIVRCLRHARSRKATLVEVKARANDEYFASMLRRGRHQIFWRDSCSSANSYYFDANGDVPLRPSPTLETMWRSERFPLRDYEFANR
jgi:cation diffusion facilitator CzcD-associated flavoprotein CzcO